MIKFVALPIPLLNSILEDLEDYIKHTYHCDNEGNPHPALKYRYDRDTQDIIEAKRLIAEAQKG